MTSNELNHEKIPSLEMPRVLIADDDEATRILLRMALSQWGYHVIEAQDGEEAWKILQEPNPPQILTLDWLMPKLDGVSLCKRIDQELNYRPYIIFLTRMAGTENVIKGLESGADEFILKPFDLAELRIRVFAGERIIKYRNQLAEQSKQLKNYAINIKKLAMEQVKELIPFADLAILLQEIQTALDEVKDNLDKERNLKQVEKIQATQTKLNNIIDIVKGFSSNIKPQITTAPVHLEITSKESMINMQRMQAFFGNDLAAIKDFIETFISLSSEQLKSIKTAIENQDSKSAKYFCHLLGSASGNSGMMAMYELCGKAEEKIVQADWEAVNECYSALESMLKELKSELDKLTKE